MYILIMTNSFKFLAFKIVHKYLFYLFIFTLPLMLTIFYFLIQKTMDLNLKQSANVALLIADHELLEIDTDHSNNAIVDERVFFQVFMNDKLTLHSKNSPTYQVTKSEGYETHLINDEYWRTFTKYDGDLIKIIVAEKNSIRTNLIKYTFSIIILLYFIFYGILKIMINKIINILTLKLLNKVDDIYEEKNTKTINELEPISKKINAYKQILDDKNRKEKEFLEHVSHELRTPLATMKLNIKCEDKILLGSYQKIENIIMQFLALSRGEKGQLSKFSMTEILTSLIEEFLLSHEDIDFDIDIEEDFFINANKELFKMMLSNCIKNSLQKGSKLIRIHVNYQHVHIIDFCEPLEKDQKIRGYGIGLLIIQRILEDIKGIFNLSNNNQNGVTASFYFVECNKIQ